jgi:DNA-binding FrmR family transcriptional regulator
MNTECFKQLKQGYAVLMDGIKKREGQMTAIKQVAEKDDVCKCL